MGEYICHLKKYRQFAGLTQDELAREVNVRRETNAPIEEIVVFDQV